jgi:hypothetical protein
MLKADHEANRAVAGRPESTAGAGAEGFGGQVWGLLFSTSTTAPVNLHAPH